MTAPVAALTRAIGYSRVVPKINLASLVGISLAIGLPACGSGAGSGKDTSLGIDASELIDGGDGLIEVQILAINDFHGQLESPGTVLVNGAQVPAGGVAHLSAHLQAAASNASSTVIVSAGDLIGGSPLISALFHDEPTIEAMNLMNLAINAVGNHEFDEDLDELMRMKNGGCHPAGGCYGGDGFDGAEFTFLAANAVHTLSQEPIFPAYEVRTLQGIQIGFIGLTTQNTPATTTPITAVDFLEETAVINAAVAELQGMGVESIVVIIHEGGHVLGGGINDCVGLTGAIVDIVNGLDSAVDLVISGHTHAIYNCVINDIPISSANAKGNYFSDIRLRINPTTSDVVHVDVNNVPVTHDLSPDASMQALVDEYAQLAAPIANVPVGQITGNITRAVGPSGESQLGDLVADAQLAATSDESVVAFQQKGGLRSDFLFAASGAETMDGQVTYNEAFTVQPFQNLLVTMTLTGQQIHDLLEQQWTNSVNPPLQVSAGFSYTWDLSALPGDKVDPADILIDGVPIDLAAAYRVTTNSFLSPGGDGYTVFTQGTNVTTRAVDLDALVAYFAANSPIDPPTLGRINVVP